MLRRAAALALPAALAMSAPASASTVNVEQIISHDVDGVYLVYEAAPGERNHVRVTYAADGGVLVHDTAGITASAACTQLGPFTARCALGTDSYGDVIGLGDGDDIVVIAGKAPAGDGEISIQDGAGDDAVHGSSAADVIYDGPGRDRLYGGGGDDTLYSGTGADVLSGGIGLDTVSYDSPLHERSRGVRADLDGDAGDGARGEHDWIRADVENLTGTDHVDLLKGNARENRLIGRGGRDLIFGLAGDDVIDATSGTASVTPGPGADSVSGGRIVHARDGARDRITGCGTAIADLRDVVTSCTRVRRG
jgi:Ca2+-binding RTX toxin-like protein